MDAHYRRARTKPLKPILDCCFNRAHIFGAIRDTAHDRQMKPSVNSLSVDRLKSKLRYRSSVICVLQGAATRGRQRLTDQTLFTFDAEEYSYRRSRQTPKLKVFQQKTGFVEIGCCKWNLKPALTCCNQRILLSSHAASHRQPSRNFALGPDHDRHEVRR